MQMQVIRILLPIGIKALLDGKRNREATRERNRAAVLDKLARQFDNAATEVWTVVRGKPAGWGRDVGICGPLQKPRLFFENCPIPRPLAAYPMNA